MLDPSFGGCSFLRAALSELKELETPDAGCLIHGVDIDQGARAYAEELVAAGVPSDNFRFADFFSVEPGGMGRFAAVVGNPPYVRHHWLERGVRERAVQACEREGVRLSGLASAWAYFVVHASSFVSEQGRLAFLLPGAVLHADYAGAVLRALETRFKHLAAVRLGERLFPDAEEHTVLLLAAGRQDDARARVTICEAATIDDLTRLLVEDGGSVLPDNGSTQQGWKEALLSGEAQAILRRLREESQVLRLGDLARISIGVVTGANSFFVRSAEEERALQGLKGVQFTPVVARAGWLRTPRWAAADQDAVESSGRPARLLQISATMPPWGRILALVDSGMKAGLHERTKCAIRSPWYALTDTVAPDCFLPYMGAQAPRLILNSAGATCTNAIHRISWKDAKVDVGAAVIGSWTSLFALSAELMGRSYGGGVLKVEPSAAARLLVPFASGSEEWLDDLDHISRQQGVAAAIAFADQRVLREGLGLSMAQVKAVRAGVGALAARRRVGGQSGDGA